MTGRHDFVLSAAEFDLLLDDLGAGRAPFPLQVPSVGATLEERAELTGAMYRDLTARGLAAAGRVDTELVRLLRLLVHHDIAVDAVGHLRRPVRALAAADEHAGVLAEVVADQVGLTGIRPAALAGAIVGVLPAVTAGPGRAMSVSRGALARAVGTDDEVEFDPFGDDLDDRTALTRAGVPAADAEALVDLANARIAGGQFGASHHAARSTTLITWFDTGRGRYLAVSQESWLSVAPGDNARIESRVARLLSTLN